MPSTARATTVSAAIACVQNCRANMAGADNLVE
jgi:hypothetical protein